MAFNEFSFLAFFVLFYLCFVLLYKCCDNKKTVQWFLIVACIGYVSCINWKFAVCATSLAVFTYCISCYIERLSDGIRKSVFIVGVAVVVGQLCVFKYYNFFVDMVYSLTTTQIPTFKLILPLGISFYTFSALSYIFDVYKKKYSPNKCLADVLLYILFFPKLACGPIVRANEFFSQKFNVSKDNILIGVQIFVFGFFKKTVLADHLGIFVNDVFSVPQIFDGVTVIFAMVSYSLQIYFDFSGYSDMAIGVSRMLGYEFGYNFCLPYISENPTEFWKRWHISLSSWLQEYVYYPLGGNRCSKIKNYANLLLTMLIGGLWHGANWTFVVWGGLHGLGLIFHKI